jgi:hypothetical protein
MTQECCLLEQVPAGCGAPVPTPAPVRAPTPTTRLAPSCRRAERPVNATGRRVWWLVLSIASPAPYLRARRLPGCKARRPRAAPSARQRLPAPCRMMHPCVASLTGMRRGGGAASPHLPCRSCYWAYVWLPGHASSVAESCAENVGPARGLMGAHTCPERRGNPNLGRSPPPDPVIEHL